MNNLVPDSDGKLEVGDFIVYNWKSATGDTSAQAIVEALTQDIVPKDLIVILQELIDLYITSIETDRIIIRKHGENREGYIVLVRQDKEYD